MWASCLLILCFELFFIAIFTFSWSLTHFPLLVSSISPTFQNYLPVVLVQKIRKLPLGTKKCPLCIPVRCPVISLWLCWGKKKRFVPPGDLGSQPWDEAVWFSSYVFFFLVPFSCWGTGTLAVFPFGRETPVGSSLTFLHSLNFITFVVTSISKEFSSGSDILLKSSEVKPRQQQLKQVWILWSLKSTVFFQILSNWALFFTFKRKKHVISKQLPTLHHVKEEKWHPSFEARNTVTKIRVHIFIANSAVKTAMQKQSMT